MPSVSTTRDAGSQASCDSAFSGLRRVRDVVESNKTFHVRNGQEHRAGA